jgi:hypothetical protein
MRAALGVRISNRRPAVFAVIYRKLSATDLSLPREPWSITPTATQEQRDNSKTSALGPFEIPCGQYHIDQK